MKEIVIKRPTIGSAFKMIFGGLLFGLLPLMITFSIMAVFGMNTITWNGEAITGPFALVAGPLISVFMTVAFTLFVAPIVWLGLLIFSNLFKKPITLSYISTEE